MMISKTIFIESCVKTDRDRFMCTILLFKDCLDNTIYRWLKELGNISSKNIKIKRIRIQVERTHPINFNWPKRMLQLLSLSLVDPNLTYSGSSAFLNRSLVVLSKQRTIWSSFEVCSCNILTHYHDTQRVVDHMKPSPEDCDLLLVGGGSIIAPTGLRGASVGNIMLVSHWIANRYYSHSSHY